MVAITAVIPTLNRPGLLREALRSLQQQTLPPDEIIVVDDGSTPAVDQAALNAEFGPSVRVLRNESSRGLAYGRNWGVEEANGKYVVHLDDDDLLAPTTLEEGHRILETDQTLEVLFLGVEGFGPRSDHFNRVQPEAVAKLYERAKGTKVADNLVCFGTDLMIALLWAVPSAFQHTMLPRRTWTKVSTLRWRAYKIATSARTVAEAKALITGQLRDSEWAMYAAAACTRTALLDAPRYLARCEGQSMSSRPENLERHMVQSLAIKTQLSRATGLPELSRWRDAIRDCLARAETNVAYHYLHQGRRMLAFGHACAGLRARPSFATIRLAVRVWLPRAAHAGA